MKKERWSRGQITTEYLIILAVVLLITLVVAALFNFFPSVNISSVSKIKKEFLENSKPIAIREVFYKKSSARLYLVLNSKIEQNMTIRSIFLNGKKIGFFSYDSNSWEGVGSALCNPSSCSNSACVCSIFLKPFEELSIVSEPNLEFANCTTFFESRIEFNYSLENFSSINYSPVFGVVINCID
ncbi:MAG: hypothetical protein QXH71_02405 [Candidatus Anstonellaceae archaeon]